MAQGTVKVECFLPLVKLQNSGLRPGQIINPEIEMNFL